MPRPGVILQARMGSSRLPGKVLLPLAGRPMIDRVVDQLQRMTAVKMIVLATSTAPADDSLFEHVKRSKINVFRGSELDVLDRYYECAQAFDLDPIVRATGDNPFVDPEEGDRLVRFFHDGGLDYAANSPSLGGGLPLGIGLEIIGRDSLVRSWTEGRAHHHREHVNEYILENTARFRTGVPQTPPEKTAPNLCFTVDTPADFAMADRLLTLHAAAGSPSQPGTSWLIVNRPLLS